MAVPGPWWLSPGPKKPDFSGCHGKDPHAATLPSPLFVDPALFPTYHFHTTASRRRTVKSSSSAATEDLLRQSNTVNTDHRAFTSCPHSDKTSFVVRHSQASASDRPPPLTFPRSDTRPLRSPPQIPSTHIPRWLLSASTRSLLTSAGKLLCPSPTA